MRSLCTSNWNQIGTVRCRLRSLPPVISMLLVAIFPFYWAAPAYGQATVGSIVGTISERTGATLSGASISVVNQETNASRVVSSDSRGSFNVPDLEPGTYRVVVTSANFKQAQRTDVIVAAQVVVRLDIALTLGDNSAVITVSAARLSSTATVLQSQAQSPAETCWITPSTFAAWLARPGIAAFTT
jgi:hypothetical protein